MTGQDWLVTNDGQCKPFVGVHQPDYGTDPYRLYRFLTDLENVLNHIVDDQLRLQAICPLVRQLLTSSAWLQIMPLEPDPELGWDVTMLYDEPFFPLTVQLVAWAPGVTSPIHNHATWGVVALLSGQEKNTFWQRSPTAEFPDQIASTGEHIITPGDIICFLPDAIHQIEAIADQPTISFNLYGETHYDQRFEFDVNQHTTKNF
ncbi:MAG: cupin [Leptolyngbyaceae cyanobacterium bins.349]|nr:cupin [Leptolyngbyaceae cyanobacterium bins.349]